MTDEISATDLDYLPWISSHIFLDEITSTNSYALNNISELADKSPCLVVARAQTAGRGRGHNKWWSARGNLTCSLIIKQDMIQPECLGLLAFTAALAVGNGIEQTIQQHKILQFKWPNDIYYHEQKLAGILIESKQTVYVVGVGINVNQNMADTPVDFKNRAISLSMIQERSINFHTLLNNLLTEFEQQLRQDHSSIIKDWQGQSFLQDRIVSISTPTGEVQGRCIGVNEKGHLMLMTLRGTEEIVAGSVTSFE